MKTINPVSTSEKIDKKTACPTCFRPLNQCFCNKLTPIQIFSKLLILQHPQEQYKVLNSAKLSQMLIENSVLKIGLSWKNLDAALGEETNVKDWAVLYLKGIVDPTRPIELFTAKNMLLPIKTKFKGIVVLDGSWKQAKSMWWRNPWLLKLNRITLNPEHPSLRGQAKKQGLSTIEAIALALDCLKESPEIGNLLRKNYKEFIIDKF